MTRPRALIVDDDEPIRSMLATVVEHNGFDVETARDGREAIARLDADGYSVVLLDLMMPYIDGYEVIRHMQRTTPELLDCTIVATAVPEMEAKRELPHDIFKVHLKPFDLAELLNDVRRCADKAA